VKARTALELELLREPHDVSQHLQTLRVVRPV
jgi:hypothetical protein